MSCFALLSISKILRFASLSMTFKAQFIPVRSIQTHEYESLEQLRGSMSLVRCPDPHHFERVQYIRSLETYQPQWDLRRSEVIQVG
jgi:dihydroorotate dehydrogenase (fumarate)